MFRDVKVGDRVWEVKKGWGEIYEVDGASPWPIKVSFVVVGVGTTASFTYEGKDMDDDLHPTLFWDEIVITAPEKPVKLAERTFEGWVNLYEDMQPYFHTSLDMAARSISDSSHIYTFPVKIVVSGVPEGFTFAKVDGWRLNESA